MQKKTFRIRALSYNIRIVNYNYVLEQTLFVRNRRGEKLHIIFIIISIYKKYILLCLPYDLEFEAISDLPRPPVIGSNLSEFVFQPEI